MLQLFNTETRKKAPFETREPKKVSMYTCGPTVYNFAHIGNFRTYVFEDVLRRTFKYFGYEVEQVMNLTDVDDKTIRGAVAEGKSLSEYTQPYIDAFFADLDTLGIERVEHYPAATEYVAQMIEMIEDLIQKGIAYQGKDGCVYFAIQKFPRYGRLSHLKLDQLKTGGSNRVEADEYDKENASDFVLWKGYDPERDGQVFWESPWGKGRPGWHLECSAMAMHILGETIDLHVGGVDNIFPHHENEIAQSEACSGHTFANHWMHSEHLVVENQKMAKSAGNFFTLRDLLDKGYTGAQVRYLLLSGHYRTQLNFTFEGLEGAKSAMQRIEGCLRRLQEIQGEAGELPGFAKRRQEEFDQALADDLNTPQALAALFELIRETNSAMDQLSAAEAAAVVALFARFDQVLNVMSFEESVPEEILAMAEQRQMARANKEWAVADELRDKIHAAGFEIEDTKEGMRVVPR